jgi:Tfp pilus assembly protein PilV
MMEVLVALVLFVMAFVIVLSPLQLKQRSAMECSQRMGALALANDLIEQERGLPFDKIVSLQGTRDPYSYSLVVRQQPNLKTLTLLIRWGHDKQLEYGTLVQGDSP